MRHIGREQKIKRFEDLPDILTLPQIADFLQISTTHAYHLAEDGLIPVIRLGRAVRVRKKDFGRFLGIVEEVGEGERAAVHG